MVAASAREAIGARGRFTFAVSGGRSPWEMFRELAAEDVAWDRVGIWQVDERVAPDGDPDRNLTELAPVMPSEADLAPMDVTDADLEAAAERYAASLPESFDLIHLGMGDDGHTASLVPGDPVLEVTDRDVSLTSEYRGRRRMTFTYPVLDRARGVLWFDHRQGQGRDVAGAARGRSVDPSGRVSAARQLVVADAAAASELGEASPGS